jgi:uncharacterized protein
MLLRSIVGASIALFVALAGQCQTAGITDTSKSPHAVLRAIPLNSVRWTGGFWGERFDLCRRSMIPDMWRVLQIPDNGASIHNFLVAAGREEGRSRTTPFGDGDFYKWLESVAHVYAATRAPELDRQMDEVIGVIAQAQAADGYISTPIQIGSKKRWERFGNHELYNMGHLMTAAAIHYRATGKRTLLDVARKNADYLYRVFEPRPKELAHFCFNPSQIMGLVELYRATGEKRHLELAGIFVDMRGSQPGGSDNHQARTPLRRESEALGHAVVGPYLWAGAADVYMETGEGALRDALSRLWSNVTERKMYVTGAIGAVHQSASHHKDLVTEAFGKEYELPSRTAYNETCANIANAMWNWRMLGLSGDARHADVMELVFHNSMLSGVSLSGKEFFYTNVLRRYGADLPMLWLDTLERWPDTAPSRHKELRAYCCPPNVVRTVASLHEYAYAVSDGAVWVNLYGANRLELKRPGGSTLKLRQETGYPRDGRIRLVVEQPDSSPLALRLRIPGWSEGATLKLNGAPQAAPAKPGAYAELRRRWNAGDVLELDLPMPVRLLESNPYVEESRNQVAVARGPIVYCLESPDVPAGVRLSEIAIPARVQFTPRHDKDLLNGVTVLEGRAVRYSEGDWSKALFRSWRPAKAESLAIRLIPYYAWANRGVSHMSVWMPRVME